MLRRLKIDPEFQSKIPPLTFEEMNLLEANILEEGRIISPLIVWNDLIVDGHNRFAILKNHPEIKYTVLEKEFANRYEAIVWICKNQLGRRNLTPEQRKYLIGKQYEAEKVSRGGERPNSHMRDENGMFTAKSQNVTLRCDEGVIKRIADENNVSRMFVFRAEDFSQGVDAADEAVPGTRAKILSGEVKPTAAELAAVSRAAPEERPALVEEICKTKKRAKSQRSETKAPATTAVEPARQEELPPEPRLETSESLPPVKVDLQKLKDIAASRYHVKRIAEGADMLCEIEAAAANLTERWNQVFQFYPDIFENPDSRAGIGEIIQDLMTYLKEVEEKIS